MSEVYKTVHAIKALESAISILEKEGKYAEALNYIEQLVGMMDRDLNYEAKTIENFVSNKIQIASKYARQLITSRDMKAALDLLKRIEQISLGLGQYAELSANCLNIVYNTMAYAYKEAGQGKLAQIYSEKAIKLTGQEAATANYAVNLLTNCESASLLGNHKLALSQARMAVEHLKREINQIKSKLDSTTDETIHKILLQKEAILGNAYYNVGLQEEYLQNNGSAYEHFRKAHILIKENPESDEETRKKIEKASAISEGKYKEITEAEVPSSKHRIFSAGHARPLTPARKVVESTTKNPINIIYKVKESLSARHLTKKLDEPENSRNDQNSAASKLATMTLSSRNQFQRAVFMTSTTKNKGKPETVKLQRPPRPLTATPSYGLASDFPMPLETLNLKRDIGNWELNDREEANEVSYDMNNIVDRRDNDEEQEEERRLRDLGLLGWNDKPAHRIWINKNGREESAKFFVNPNNITIFGSKGNITRVPSQPANVFRAASAERRKFMTPTKFSQEFKLDESVSASAMDDSRVKRPYLAKQRINSARIINPRGYTKITTPVNERIDRFQEENNDRLNATFDPYGRNSAEDSRFDLSPLKDDDKGTLLYEGQYIHNGNECTMRIYSSDSGLELNCVNDDTGRIVCQQSHGLNKDSSVSNSEIPKIWKEIMETSNGDVLGDCSALIKRVLYGNNAPQRVLVKQGIKMFKATIKEENSREENTSDEASMKSSNHGKNIRVHKKELGAKSQSSDTNTIISDKEKGKDKDKEKEKEKKKSHSKAPRNKSKEKVAKEDSDKNKESTNKVHKKHIKSNQRTHSKFKDTEAKEEKKEEAKAKARIEFFVNNEENTGTKTADKNKAQTKETPELHIEVVTIDDKLKAPEQIIELDAGSFIDFNEATNDKQEEVRPQAKPENEPSKLRATLQAKRAFRKSSTKELDKAKNSNEVKVEIVKNENKQAEEYKVLKYESELKICVEHRQSVTGGKTEEPLIIEPKKENEEPKRETENRKEEEVCKMSEPVTKAEVVKIEVPVQVETQNQIKVEEVKKESIHVKAEETKTQQEALPIKVEEIKKEENAIVKEEKNKEQPVIIPKENEIKEEVKEKPIEAIKEEVKQVQPVEEVKDVKQEKPKEEYPKELVLPLIETSDKKDEKENSVPPIKIEKEKEKSKEVAEAKENTSKEALSEPPTEVKIVTETNSQKTTTLVQQNDEAKEKPKETTETNLFIPQNNTVLSSNQDPMQSGFGNSNKEEIENKIELSIPVQNIKSSENCVTQNSRPKIVISEKQSEDTVNEKPLMVEENASAESSPQGLLKVEKAKGFDILRPLMLKYCKSTLRAKIITKLQRWYRRSTQKQLWKLKKSKDTKCVYSTCLKMQVMYESTQNKEDETRAETYIKLRFVNHPKTGIIDAKAYDCNKKSFIKSTFNINPGATETTLRNITLNLFVRYTVNRELILDLKINAPASDIKRIKEAFTQPMIYSSVGNFKNPLSEFIKKMGQKKVNGAMFKKAIAPPESPKEENPQTIALREICRKKKQSMAACKIQGIFKIAMTKRLVSILRIRNAERAREKVLLSKAIQVNHRSAILSAVNVPSQKQILLKIYDLTLLVMQTFSIDYFFEPDATWDEMREALSKILIEMEFNEELQRYYLGADIKVNQIEQGNNQTQSIQSQLTENQDSMEVYNIIDKTKSMREIYNGLRKFNNDYYVVASFLNKEGNVQIEVKKDIKNAPSTLFRLEYNFGIFLSTKKELDKEMSLGNLMCNYIVCNPKGEITYNEQELRKKISEIEMREKSGILKKIQTRFRSCVSRKHFAEIVSAKMRKTQILTQFTLKLGSSYHLVKVIYNKEIGNRLWIKSDKSANQLDMPVTVFGVKTINDLDSYSFIKIVRETIPRIIAFDPHKRYLVARKMKT